MKTFMPFYFIALIMIFVSCSQDQVDLNPNDQSQAFRWSISDGEVNILDGRIENNSHTPQIETRSPVSASGHYQFELLPSGGEHTSTITFTAKQNNGGIHGNAQIDLDLVGIIISIKTETTCLVVEDNRATIGGVITDVLEDGNLPNIFTEGNLFYFAVEDNGQGSNTPSDEVSVVLYVDTPESETSCETYPPFSVLWEICCPWVEVLPGGQIHVKG